MAFIQTIPPEEATGDLEKFYAEDVDQVGYVKNTTRTFSLRPEVYGATMNLMRLIRSNLDPRRYELVTLIAASRLRCTYCSLAHGEVLHSRFYNAEQIQAIMRDYRTAGLEPADVAMLSFAEQVTLNAYRVLPEDIEMLRAQGFSDPEIFDIAAAAAIRCLFSKILDALGTDPDPVLLDMEHGLRHTLTVGRPFGAAEPSLSV